MFSHATGGSKAALIALCRLLEAHGMPLLDAQVTNPHLLSMGAIELSRDEFLGYASALAAEKAPRSMWG